MTLAAPWWPWWRRQGGKEYAMDTQPADADADDRDESLFRLIRHIEERLGQTAVLLCKACTSTGRCAACGGNGRTYVRGHGMCDCSVCSGDGACISCKGTGRVQPA